MIGLLGYNFCRDTNCLDPNPTNVNMLVSMKIQNGIFDHMNITMDTTSPYSTALPDEWTVATLFDADFDGNISGGNLEQLAGDITGVRIKRRVQGSFDWITIKELEIEDTSALSFFATDNLAADDMDYEYALVPMVNGVEGIYKIVPIHSQFNGVYLADADTIYKFYAGVSYGTMENVQQTGVFTPYGRQYPVVVSNGVTNYRTGSLTGSILPEDYEQTGDLDRGKIRQQHEVLMKFLMNKKPKILKDWNGNSWVIFVTSNPQTTYRQGSGMGMMDVSFNWTELGDADNKTDLYENGLIPTEN